MNTQQKIKTGAWISGRVDKPFRWGTWDCNTFFIEWHDMIYSTDDLSRVAEQYASKSGAKAFMRKLALTPGQWLHMRSYKKQTEKKKTWQAGDVALIEHKWYATVFVYFDGAFWSVPEEGQLTGYTPKAVTKHITSWWRKDG